MPLTATAFDTETKLIRRGHVVPELVCMSEASESGKKLWHRSSTKLFGRMVEMLKGRVVGHNLAYDLAVMCAEYPKLFPHAFDAAFGMRLEDTGINDKLFLLGTTGDLNYLDGRKLRFRLNDTGLRWGQEDRSAEKEGEDIWRLRYGELIDKPLSQWEPDARQYAIDDAVETFEIWKQQMTLRQEEGPGSMNTREFQAAVDFCLQLYSARGILTDVERVEELDAKLEELMAPERNAEMIKAGILDPPQPPRPYKNGARDHAEGCPKTKTKGEWDCDCPPMMKAAEPAHTRQKPMQERLRAACAAFGIPEVYTKKGADKGIISTEREYLENFEELDPALSEYSLYKKHEKLRSTYVSHMREGIVYPYYNIIVETGRTSARRSKTVPSVQVQNQPRVSGELSIRECFIPRPGFWFIFSDINSMELCTFAQKCHDLGFHSRMMDIINAGIDAHAYLGAQIASMFDEEFAKRCYDARAVTTDEIYEVFMAWREVNPERWKHFRTFAKPTNLGYPGGLGPDTFIQYAWGTFRVRVTRDEAVRLKQLWLKTFPEAERYLDWVNRQGDPEHFDSMCYYSPKGMYRANTTYCSTANGAALQSPGAEGAKTGAALVARECYDVTQRSILIKSFPIAFIHDEVGLEVPADYSIARPTAKRVEELMVAGLQSVCPDVKLGAQSALMDRWYKEAEPAFNEDGELVLWQPQEAA